MTTDVILKSWSEVERTLVKVHEHKTFLSGTVQLTHHAHTSTTMSNADDDFIISHKIRYIYNVTQDDVFIISHKISYIYNVTQVNFQHININITINDLR